MKTSRFTFSSLFLLAFLAVVPAQAADRFVSFTQGDLLIHGSGNVVGGVPATLFVDAADERGVARAVRSLCVDFGRVTGVEAKCVTTSVPPTAAWGGADGAAILIGTLGHSPLIDRLVRDHRLDVSPLKGKREMYLIQVVADQLVIIGSDRRGTIFGIYELSRQMGVSPWYYWADVPTAHHDCIYVNRGTYTDGEPAVRYRGIFLNDEAPCLTSWVKNTFGTNYGGHDFYEHVFELILRLKGNFLWPAMWSWAFYADDPQNSPLADEMGVIIGTSHHEPMARNHQEWARHRAEYGAWNYQTNQQVIDRFFREGVERAKNTDDIITIGMRGDGDEAMSEDADTKLLQKIVNNQRRIIKEVTGRNPKDVPQVWALYKEVLDYYDKGMKVPDDVLMLLCDDNWGNLRRVPTAQERKHPGGWGLYYHVDYVGAPRNSKWLNVTPAQNMWEQLTLAYTHGIDRMWILNVGDLKPMEYPITLFMDMAWRPSSVGRDIVATHIEPFCASVFGEQHAAEAARLLNLCCKYAGRTTAEMLDCTTYSLAEWPQVVGQYQQLERDALRLFVQLPVAQHDAYRQLILFPIQAMANVYEMYYAQAMNQQLYKGQNPDCNEWADRVGQCFRRDSLLCAQYNHDIADGKWNGMMTQKHIGYRSWNDDFGPRDVMPRVHRLPSLGEESGASFVFTPRDGYVAMEAEHTYARTDGSSARWTVLPFVGRTLSGITLMPYDQPVDGAALEYRFRSPGTAQQVPGTVKIHVVVKSTLDYLNTGGLCYEVSLDGGEAVKVNFNDNLNEKPENIYSIYYPTVARRVIEKVVELPLSAQTDVHTLTLRPLHPAIVFEKVVVDLGGYQPSFLFGDESPKTVEASR